MHGLGFIDLGELAADGRDQAHRVARRADCQAHFRSHFAAAHPEMHLFGLQVREVHLRRRRHLRPGADIVHHAHDGHPVGLPGRVQDSPAQAVLTGEETVGEGFVHDDDAGRAFPIGIAEVAALHQGNAQGPKIIRAYHHQ